MKHLLPKEAWALLQKDPEVLFVDVRMEVESLCVGYPPGVKLVPWYEYPDYKADALRFVTSIDALAGSKDRTVMLICRSGQRTVDAAKALEKAGYTNVINVLDGFEGELDDDNHRGTEAGWRYSGLPWIQS